MNDSNHNRSAPKFDGHIDGRNKLKAWRESQPDNAFRADSHFRDILSVYKDGEKHARLEETLDSFGREVATVVDGLVKQNNKPGNHPRLNRYTGIGERTEEVEHHPSYHESGEYIYGSGIISAYDKHPNSIGVFARTYLSCYNGEAGHNCPVGCTAGVVRVLQELADDSLREKYLPGFLNPDYGEHLEGAQFLTEVQGGSDVGANATRAIQQEDGSWRIHGEKWFCSNIDADVFLMTARFDLDKEGTSSLGLFFVPRQLDDGSPNEFHIRRLKDKLGTRSMASAECDFRGAKAYALGDPENGFKNMMTYVINTSRLFNACLCAGIARRSYVEAQTYAQNRSAFDQPIGDYPLVQETLADMKAETDTMTSVSMHMAYLQDLQDGGQLDQRGEQFLRMALNLNKMMTAKSARWTAVQGIEVFGGNGAIETFSVVPRMLRDSIVAENWEGTHNTLQMQIMRDMKKYGVHEGYFEYLHDLLAESRDEDNELKQTVQKHIRAVRDELGKLAKLDKGASTLKMRPLTESLAYLNHAAIRLWERGQMTDVDQTSSDSTKHFIQRRLEGIETQTSGDYLQRIKRLSKSL